MQLRLRLAEVTDTDALRELDSVARRGDPARIAVIHDAVADGRCLVAEAGGRVVGYVVARPNHFFGRDFVELLMVDEGVRRHGVGRALLRAVVDRAGTSRVFSSTNESNAPMRALLAAERWRLSGRLDGLDDGDPEVVYFIDR